mgnify:CR=1 FL=1
MVSIFNYNRWFSLFEIFIYLIFVFSILAITYDESGEEIIYNQIVAFVVGAGNFGGKSQTTKIKPIAEAPSRAPDASFVDKTLIDQVSWKM